MLQNLPCFCNPYFFLGVSFQQYLEHIPVPFVDKDLCNSSAHYNGHLGLSDICTGSRTDRPICKVCVVNKCYSLLDNVSKGALYKREYF